MLYSHGMGPGGASERIVAFDRLKALAIVAVVCTHAVRFDWGPPRYDWDFLLGMAWTSFHVPAFLFVSGFLYFSREPVGMAKLRPRLQRVLVPYLVISTLAQLVGVSDARCGGANPWWSCAGDVAFDYLSASTLGVYYYVFLIVFSILFVHRLSRMKPRHVVGLWAFCVIYTIAIDLQVPRISLLPALFGYRDYDVFFWTFRDPFDHFHLGAFLSGWVFAMQQERWRELIVAHRRQALLLAVLLTGIGMAMTLQWLPFAPGIRRIVYTYGVIGLFLLGTGARPLSPVTRFLSEASLGIYLIHRILQRLLDPTANAWPDAERVLGQIGLSLVGSCIVLWIGRRLFGVERARRWLGA